jgi:hypothetical protein
MKNVAYNFDEGRLCGEWELSEEARAVVNQALWPIFEAIVLSFFTELEIELGL